MEPVKYMRADTQLPTEGTADLSELLGTWINADPETDDIIRFILAGQNDTFTVQVYGANTPEPIDWGEVEATPCATGTTLEIAGFDARYDFGPVETLLAAYGAKGVLVIQTYTRFKDGSGRPDYFTREFFHQ